MRHRALSIAAIFVAVAAACAPTDTQTAETTRTQDRAQTEERLLGLEQQWIEGLQTGDLSILEEILAPDFIYTVLDGQVLDKEAFISGTGAMSWDSFEAGPMTVRWFSDDVVVITGTDTSSGVDAEGNEFNVSSAWTNLWMYRAGEWQCVLGHATPIAE